MAILNFVPNLWAASTLKSFEQVAVFPSVCNRNYEGLISAKGDKVTICQLDNPVAQAYTGTVTPVEMHGATQDIIINNQEYTAFFVDDVEAAQSSVSVMAEYTAKGAAAIANVLDLQIAALYAESGSAVGTALSPIDVNSKNILEVVGDVVEALNTQNIPQSGRWMVIPPWFLAKLVISKVNLDTSNSSTINNSFYTGRYQGMDLFVSNNVSEASAKTGSRIMAGTRDAISLAITLKKVEAYRLESSFASAVRTLWLWGHKVISPAALVTLYATEIVEV